MVFIGLTLMKISPPKAFCEERRPRTDLLLAPNQPPQRKRQERRVAELLLVQAMLGIALITRCQGREWCK